VLLKLNVASDWEDEFESDVVVIGAGIGGLSCAALLVYYGLKVGAAPRCVGGRRGVLQIADWECCWVTVVG